jgi:hypothetical protein
MSSRTKIIRDRSTAKILLADSPRRRLLLSFVPRARSIGEAAELERVDMGRMHYVVRDFVRRGLLKVEREQKRAGRAVRYYRATAERFTVPVELVSASPGAGLAQELRHRLDQELSRADDEGIVFYVGDDGEPRASWFGKKPRRRPVAEFWHMPSLSDSDARRLIMEIGALLERYEHKAGNGKPFLVHSAVVPRS